MKRTAFALLLAIAYLCLAFCQHGPSKPLQDRHSTVHGAVPKVLLDSILFQDDFSTNLQKWQSATGTWSIDDGKLKGVGHGVYIDAWIYAGDSSWTDYELSAKVFFKAGDAYQGSNAEFVVRSTGHWQNEYRISVWPPSGFMIGYYTDSSFSGWQMVSSGVPIRDTAEIKVQVIGRRIAVYVDSEFVWGDGIPPSVHSVTSFATTGTTLFAGLRGTSGRIGLGVIYDYVVMFDDVKVRQLHPVVTDTPSGNGWTYLGLWGSGAVRSENNGASWTVANTRLGNTAVNALAVGTGGTNLFAGTGSGVYLSTNGGTGWTAAGLVDSTIHALAVADMNLYAGTNRGTVLLSTDNGMIWSSPDTGLGGNTVRALVVSGTRIFAGQEAVWGGG